MHIPIRVGVSPTLHIRGLLADADIKKGQVIERCPLILVGLDQLQPLSQTVLWRYHYEWNARNNCIVLGYGSLYNHSYTPNVRYGFNYQGQCLVFTALRQIAAGEELMINYNYENTGEPEPVASYLSDFDPHRQPKKAAKRPKAGRSRQPGRSF